MHIYHLRKDKQLNWQRHDLAYELSTQIIKQHPPHRRGNFLHIIHTRSSSYFLQARVCGNILLKHLRALIEDIQKKQTRTLQDVQELSNAKVSMRIIQCNSCACQEMWPKHTARFTETFLFKECSCFGFDSIDHLGDGAHTI